MYEKPSLDSPPFHCGRKCVILGFQRGKAERAEGIPMTFDEILAQILDLLKRQGRVSYGALKRRFDLDDDYLNDLKNEILYVHPVIDDEGRGLIWAGDTASGQAGAPQPAQTTQSPAVQGQLSSQVALLS